MSRHSAVLGRPATREGLVIRIAGRGLLVRVAGWWIRGVSALRAPVELR